MPRQNVFVPLMSLGLLRLPNLAKFLGYSVKASLIPFGHDAGVTWLGWGAKSSSRRAAWYANLTQGHCLRLEDGFLRSVGMGNADPPLSLVLDDLGIYYDATQQSRLEVLIGAVHTQAQCARTGLLLAEWRKARVSKYNHCREFMGSLPARYVLVVDQPLGDASIRYGLADKSSFQKMLQAALEENPDCTVLLKVDPEVMSGRKRGHFDTALMLRNARVQVLQVDAHPAGLIEHAEGIYVVTSQMGFEGLLWGRRVRTFGMPFYAGWGLTEDELRAPERRKPVELENLVYAALVEYPRYIDPETGERCEPEHLIAWMGLQRRMRERYPEVVYALGFSRWKKPIVRDFLQGSVVRFIRRADQIPHAAMLMIWGSGGGEGVKASSFQEKDGICVTRIEDGFLRSVGLGADLVRPLSWVMDGRRIYYDATVVSDLEHYLQTHHFDPALLQRAKALRLRIVELGLTKYNLSGKHWQRPLSAGRVILVPGQVESDASITFGTMDIRRNIDLLRVVRKANPDAHVVYKPHPDVAAGLRRCGVDELEAIHWCDEVLDGFAMTDLLEAVDEVHVLTSLAGFEALLRGKKVVAYGQPFYAGWGLTEDRIPVKRRTRILSLDELVAGVLILYPTYVSCFTGRFTTPERALDELLAWRNKSVARLPLWCRMLPHRVDIRN